MVFFLFGIFAGELLTTPLTNVSRLTISYRDDACALSVCLDGCVFFEIRFFDLCLSARLLVFSFESE